MRKLAIITIGVSLLIAQSALAADPIRQEEKSSSFSIKRIDHISLHNDGSLIGQVVDRHGIPQADLQVELVYQGKQIARSNTQKDGRFVIGDLRAGLHEIHFGGSVATVQLWLPNTAPPVARTVALLVPDENIVLGQRGARLSRPALFRGAVIAGIVTGATVWAATSNPPGS